ncbi:metallophosphoesterase [Alishewanella sp. 16-MA]|uniref:Metallophosphoesterase n=1 Tax=Alishewanella maricola TaxID=2795740 RepID=A0ABS8C7K7_9ALTE|nr:metallophosphoesterase [Alishewanella maricola]MCB5228332.1 metallophosphoesterase [Alishewanella maricola]
MLSIRSYLSAILLVLFISACQPKHQHKHTVSATPAQHPVQIAFLPDVHFHDIYADFSEADFPGPVNSASGHQATIRTMATQLRSTRLFNENYFALLAALDDLAERNVKLVVLPGDFSDDGQPAHVQGLSKILRQYQQEYGMQFFLTNGNHDPVKPFSRPAGKPDYLNANGQPHAVFSPGSPACPLNAPAQTDITCTEQVKELGYEGLLQQLSDFGFYPTSDYLYWETPYSHYDTTNYQFSEALTQANFTKRQYEICLQGTGGTYKESHYSHCQQVPDSSYLVEPVPGLWLLAVDANVYQIDPQQAEGTSGHQAFLGSGNAGYNAMLSHKRHVIKWMQQIAERAAKEGKTLITFSHYPMTDYYQGQANAMAELFGSTRMQLNRSPANETARKLAATGVNIHIGGHMHLNNTGTVYLDDGRYLVNIQAPSIAAYVPAYKLLTLYPQHIEAETIVLTKVPRFNELFAHYQQEHLALTAAGAENTWDPAILQSTNYRDFTNGHLSELTRQRFLPADWPEQLRQVLLQVDGMALFTLAQLTEDIPLTALTNFAALRATANWQHAEQQASNLITEAGFTPQALASWQGKDLVTDFYRLRNAGQLALADISAERLLQYKWLTRQLQPHQPKQEANKMLSQPNQSLSMSVRKQFGALFSIMHAFQHGDPNQHFLIDKATGKLTDLATVVRE